MKGLWRMRAWAIVFTVGLLVVLPAQADVRKGNGEVGFDFGFTDFDADFAGGGGGGVRGDVRFGYLISDLFEIEGMLGYSGADDGDLGTAFVNGVFNFRTGPRVMPYFLVGAGGARLEVDSLSDNGIAGQIAGGVRGFGGEGRIGLRMELGAMVLDVFDETTTQVNFTVGLTFGLGERHAHRAPRSKHKHDD
jgi:opacity protein-like surface antigen